VTLFRPACPRAAEAERGRSPGLTQPAADKGGRRWNVEEEERESQGKGRVDFNDGCRALV
jgi:hypothetical protein